MIATNYHDGPELLTTLPLCLCITRMLEQRIPAPGVDPPLYSPLQRGKEKPRVIRLRQSSLTLLPCEAEIRFTVCAATTNIKIRTRHVLSKAVWLSLLSAVGVCGVALGLLLNAPLSFLPIIFCAYLSWILPAQLLLTFNAWRKSEEQLLQHLHDLLETCPKQIPCRVLISPLPSTGRHVL